MDIRDFVSINRPDWERLETLIKAARSRGLAALGPIELRELGALHRKVSADVAASRTFHAESKIVGYLNDLALRSHNVVYRAPRRSIVQRLTDLARAIPDAVRAHRGALAASTAIFAIGLLLGAIGTVLDEGVAVLVLGSAFVERIRSGEYWVERIFDVVPHSVASAGILSNNLSVAISAFALGLTGFCTALVLFFNGVMLGAVLTLCSEYGLLSRFVAFVVPHGIIEISAILLAGAGGFTVFDGWLSPGDGSRSQGLRRGARDGLRVALAAAPALLVAGLVEGLVSPVEALPAWLRIALGLCLGLALWAWLLVPAAGPGAVAESRT